MPGLPLPPLLPTELAGLPSLPPAAPAVPAPVPLEPAVDALAPLTRARTLRSATAPERERVTRPTQPVGSGSGPDGPRTGEGRCEAVAAARREPGGGIRAGEAVRVVGVLVVWSGAVE